MKRKVVTIIVSLLLNCLIAINCCELKAQCYDLTNSIGLNSGYDYTNNSVLTYNVVNNTSDIDLNWKIKNGSTFSSAYIEDVCGGSWGNPQPNSRWIYSIDNTVNCWCYKADDPIYAFEFCLGTSVQNPSGYLDILTPDYGTVFLNGVSQSSSIQTIFTSPTPVNGYTPRTVTLNSSDFIGGKNIITIELSNNPTTQCPTVFTTQISGLNVTGSITSSNNGIWGQGDDACCLSNYNPQAKVSGIVFIDDNKNGTKESGESPVSGQLVELYDASNNFITNTLTIANGSYYFSLPSNVIYNIKLGTVDPYYKIHSPSTNLRTINNSKNRDIGGKDFGIVPNRYYDAEVIRLGNCKFGDAYCDYNTKFYIRDHDGNILEDSWSNPSAFSTVDYEVTYSTGVTYSGTGPTATNLTHTFSNTTVHNHLQEVEVYAPNNLDGYFDVNGNPQTPSIAAYYKVYSQNQSVGGCCPNLQMQLTDGACLGADQYAFTLNGIGGCSSSNQSCCIQSVNWTFDTEGTSTDPSPNFQFSTPGDKSISLDVVVNSSCTLSLQQNITIYDPSLSILAPTLACENDLVTFSYSHNNLNAPQSQSWDFGDLTTSSVALPTHQYSKGNYQVTLDVAFSQACSNTITSGIIINNPTVDIVTVPVSGIICKNDIIDFQYTYQNSASNPPTSETWDFGNGQTSSLSSPSHQYSSVGVKSVILTTVFPSGCTIVTSKDVYVDDPLVGLSFSPDEFCVGDPVTMPTYLFNSPLGNQPISQKWEFGDGTDVTTNYGDPDPSHSYTTSGSYDVSVTATFPGGCTATSSDEISVSDYASRSININSPLNLCLGKPVNFSLSGDVTDAASISWDFGNGQSSSASNPQALYTSNGTYTVSASATYAQNCVEPNPAEDQVTVHVADFDFCASCAECIGSFAPEAGKKYVLSAWVKEKGALNKTSYSDAGIRFFYEGDDVHSTTFKAKGQIIDGWQQIEQVFEIPASTTAIQVELVNSGSVDVYFDDIRIHPFDANLKSFVYDPITMRLKAELDENNYATFYEYDEDGNLIRIKKETDRGVKTIQETVKRVKQIR